MKKVLFLALMFTLSACKPTDEGKSGDEANTFSFKLTYDGVDTLSGDVANSNKTTMLFHKGYSYIGTATKGLFYKGPSGTDYALVKDQNQAKSESKGLTRQEIANNTHLYVVKLLPYGEKVAAQLSTGTLDGVAFIEADHATDTFAFNGSGVSGGSSIHDMATTIAYPYGNKEPQIVVCNPTSPHADSANSRGTLRAYNSGSKDFYGDFGLPDSAYPNGNLFYKNEFTKLLPLKDGGILAFEFKDYDKTVQAYTFPGDKDHWGYNKKSLEKQGEPIVFSKDNQLNVNKGAKQNGQIYFMIANNGFYYLCMTGNTDDTGGCAVYDGKNVTAPSKGGFTVTNGYAGPDGLTLLITDKKGFLLAKDGQISELITHDSKVYTNKAVEIDDWVAGAIKNDTIYLLSNQGTDEKKNIYKVKFSIN